MACASASFLYYVSLTTYIICFPTVRAMDKSGRGHLTNEKSIHFNAGAAKDAEEFVPDEEGYCRVRIRHIFRS